MLSYCYAVKADEFGFRPGIEAPLTAGAEPGSAVSSPTKTEYLRRINACSDSRVYKRVGRRIRRTLSAVTAHSPRARPPHGTRTVEQNVAKSHFLPRMCRTNTRPGRWAKGPELST